MKRREGDLTQGEGREDAASSSFSTTSRTAFQQARALTLQSTREGTRERKDKDEEEEGEDEDDDFELEDGSTIEVRMCTVYSLVLCFLRLNQQKNDPFDLAIICRVCC
jgi:hypothetical protein